MADSVFSLSKALSWLKSFLGTMSSPISGFDLDDVKVKEDGDVFSSLFSFSGNPGETNKFNVGDKEYQSNAQEVTDIGGNKIELSVLLKVLNARDALSPILAGINKLHTDQMEDREKGALFSVLLGDDRGEDLTIDGAKKRNSGLLGVNLTKVDITTFRETTVTYAGSSWSWGDISEDRFKYGLECQATGKDYGAIENVPLLGDGGCSKLISEYLVKVGLISDINEVSLDISNFILPILLRVQAWLGEYYQAAIKKYNPENVKNPEQKPQQEQTTQPEQTAEEEEAARRAAGEAALNTGEGPKTVSHFSSKHIDITLKKITGTSEIEMTAIKANYAPSEVVSDLDEIIWGQPDFLEVVPDELTTYSIDVDDDGFDIEPCEQCMEADPCASLCEVFKAGIRAYRNLYIIHWMSRGNDMMKLHVLAEEMYGELIQEIDTVGELLVEKQGTVPQLDFPCDYIAVQDYDFQGSLPVIQNLIQTYIDCIDYAYCNQDSDVQSTLDEWLRYWKKQLNYFVTRQEI